MAIIKVRDENGDVIDIPAFVGPKGDPGADYVLTEADKAEIAELAAELVEVPEGGEADLTGYATEQYVKDYAQPKGEYLTEETDPTVPSWAKQPNKPSYTAAEVGARPNTWMPTAKEVGALPSTYVPPDQTPEQVGADPAGTAEHTVNVHNTSTTSHNDIRLLIEGLSNDKLDADKLPTAINTALAQAKESGEFKGDPGKDGTNGKDYTFDPTVYGLPVLYLTGDTTGMTKETEVTLSYECNDKDGTAKAGSCTMKWQGSSSLAWDKKNYTIKFDNVFEVVDGWGSQKKYCLKANWIDHSHSRNVVSAKLWGLIRKNRSNLNSKLKNLPNAGAIDGFPVIIMLNGEFHGLYSWNIPKDAWMFGMGSGTKEAIVGADNQAEDTAFKAETLLDANGWELEYNSSSFTADAVKTSLNNLIKACIDSWGGDLDTTVAQYLDWESAIDYYIFAVILQGGDMITKNTILATFDGVKWYFSAYDMDTTYGLEFDGSGLVRAVTTSHTTFETIAETHRVFELIKRFKTNELKARYNALRADALSESRICNYFENYAWDISSPILVEEVKRWPSVRGSSVNGIDQICRWVRQRLEVADAWVDALPAQETPVEPEKPVEMVNQVPISTDTDGSIYNGTGYKDNARLSSSGGVSSSAQTGSVVTGFIPFKNTDVIRMKGAEWLNMTTEHSGHHFYLSFYNSSKTLIPDGYLSAESYSSDTGLQNAISIVYDEATGVTTFAFRDTNATTGLTDRVKDAAYFRLNAYGKGANLIVTVNQEITA